MRVDEKVVLLFFYLCGILGCLFLMLSIGNLSQYGKENFWNFSKSGLAEFKKRLTSRGWMFYKLAAVFILLAVTAALMWGVAHPK